MDHGENLVVSHEARAQQYTFYREMWIIKQHYCSTVLKLPLTSISSITVQLKSRKVQSVRNYLRAWNLLKKICNSGVKETAMFIYSFVNFHCPVSTFVMFGIKNALNSITRWRFLKTAENHGYLTNTTIPYIQQNCHITFKQIQV
jgi:hypothetical protein